MTATYAKFTLQLNTVTDADVIEYLKAQANKNNTIRRALRQQRAMDAYAESKEREATEHQKDVTRFNAAFDGMAKTGLEGLLPCSHCGALTKPEDFVDGIDGEMLCEACYQSHYTES